MGTLVSGRLSVAAGCLGVIEDCLTEAVTYARDRQQHHRQHHAEGAAGARPVGGHFYPPAMRLDEVAHDRQPQAEARRRGAICHGYTVETVEQSRQVFVWR